MGYIPSTDTRQYAMYSNIPMIVGQLLSKKMATWNEMETVIGVEDGYRMLEIAIVDNYNHLLSNQPL